MFTSHAKSIACWTVLLLCGAMGCATSQPGTQGVPTDLHALMKSPASTTQPAGLTDAMLQPATQDPVNRVGPRDLLEITVPDLVRLGDATPMRRRVGPDGTVDLPSLGRVALAGKTPLEAEHALRKLLCPRVLKDPQPTVVIKEPATIRVFMIGEVGSPGMYRLRRGEQSLWQAIARAGGQTRDSDQYLRLVRRAAVPGAGGQTTTDGQAWHISAAELELNVRRGRDVALMNGDVITIGRRKKRYIYVYGLVAKPGLYELPHGTAVDVTKALAMAGGLDPVAMPERAALIRQVRGARPIRVPLSLNDVTAGKVPPQYLMPGDILAVEPDAGTHVRTFIARVFRVYFGGGANVNLLD